MYKHSDKNILHYLIVAKSFWVLKFNDYLLNRRSKLKNKQSQLKAIFYLEKNYIYFYNLLCQRHTLHYAIFNGAMSTTHRTLAMEKFLIVAFVLRSGFKRFCARC